MEDLHERLRQLRAEIEAAEADEHEDVQQALSGVRHNISQFVESIEEETGELRDTLIASLLETENALRERYPGLVSSIRAAVSILSSSGI